MIAVSVGLFILVIIFGSFFYVQKKRYEQLYESVIFQLDKVLANEDMEVSPYLNSRHSAIASRLNEIKRKMDYEIDEERVAREKVHMFISDLSHQVKTPLTNVVMYQEILTKKMGLESDLKDMQDKLTAQIDKLQWILGSLFKSVYLEEEYLNFDMDYQCITQTISQAVSSVYKKADDKGIQICVEPYKDRKVLHNLKWTAEALTNVLENGIKYSPENSRIVIRIIHGEYFSEIAVKDEGPGIASEEYQSIFQRFYRSKSAGNVEGSGIGLYLVKMIIERQKGYVVVDSVKNQGSTFSLFLQNFKK